MPINSRDLKRAYDALPRERELVNKAIFFLFCIFICFFRSPIASADLCAWQKMYRGITYKELRNKKPYNSGEIHRRLDEDQYYLHLKQMPHPGKDTLAIIASLESGDSYRVALLKGRKAIQQLTKTDSLELLALELTHGDDKAGDLAQKYEQLSSQEKARFEALLKTHGDLRAAFLAELRQEKRLNSPYENIELDALLASAGDKHYADLKVKQAKKLKLEDCDQRELEYIDEQLKSKAGNEQVFPFSSGNSSQ